MRNKILLTYKIKWRFSNILKLCATRIMWGSKSRDARKEKELCAWEWEGGYWEALPQARHPGLRRAGLGKQAASELPATANLRLPSCCHLASGSASCSAVELLLLVMVDAFLMFRCSQAAPVQGLQRLMLCQLQNLSCCFVSLQPSGQPVCPTCQFPGRPLFSKRKGKGKASPIMAAEEKPSDYFYPLQQKEATFPFFSCSTIFHSVFYL